MRIALLGTLLAATGCAITGPAPAGPLRPGTTTQVQLSWALAYGPGTANVAGTRVTANAESYGGTGMEALPLPIRVGLRQSLGSAVEISGDAGWLDAGAELRAGTPGGVGAYPIAIVAGVRRGYPPSLGENTNSEHVRFEIYPDLSRAHDGSLRLALSAGLGVGSFVHSVTLPDSFRNTSDEGLFLAPLGAIVARPETRLELGIGLHSIGQRGAFEVTVLPWIVLDSGAPTKASCPACGNGFPITDYSQSWGLSLVITPTAFADIIGELTGG